jgi:hypothetical protein
VDLCADVRLAAEFIYENSKSGGGDIWKLTKQLDILIVYGENSLTNLYNHFVVSYGHYDVQPC